MLVKQHSILAVYVQTLVTPSCVSAANLVPGVLDGWFPYCGVLVRWVFTKVAQVFVLLL